MESEINAAQIHFQREDNCHCVDLLKIYNDMCTRRINNLRYVKFMLDHESVKISVSSLLLFSPWITSILSEISQDHEPVIMLPDEDGEILEILVQILTSGSASADMVPDNVDASVMNLAERLQIQINSNIGGKHVIFCKESLQSDEALQSNIEQNEWILDRFLNFDIERGNNNS